jgi:hypothetical protein
MPQNRQVLFVLVALKFPDRQMLFAAEGSRLEAFLLCGITGQSGQGLAFLDS